MSAIVAVLVIGATVYGVSYSLLFILSPSPIKYTAEERWFITPNDRTRSRLPSLDDDASLDLTVVIPAYNEAVRLPPMLALTLDHLLSTNTPPRSFEIIVVDDGSNDETVKAALSTSVLAQTSTFPTQKLDIRVVKLAHNKGKGAAVKHGFLHARGRRILMVDADGASQFRDLELLWKAMDDIETGGNAVAVGSRAHLVGTDAVVKRSFIRNLLMHGLHFCLRTLGVGHIRDTQCGFKLFTRESARSLFPTLHIAHWIFDVELLLLARLLDIPVVEVPIAWHEVAGSKINLVSDSLGMLRDLFILRANYAIGRWTVRRREKAD